MFKSLKFLISMAKDKEFFDKVTERLNNLLKVMQLVRRTKR